MRLRSFASTDCTKAVRSRSTKVQQHACSVHLPGRVAHQVLTELDGLKDKTAFTIATSLERVVRDVASTVGSAFDGLDPLLMGMVFLMVHILVGDGVPTNNKAAKILWATFLEQPPHPRFEYLLICVICASHMANLCVKQAVIGHAAEEGAKNTAAICASTDVVKARCDAVKRPLSAQDRVRRYHASVQVPPSGVPLGVLRVLAGVGVETGARARGRQENGGEPEDL